VPLATKRRGDASPGIGGLPGQAPRVRVMNRLLGSSS